MDTNNENKEVEKKVTTNKKNNKRNSENRMNNTKKSQENIEKKDNNRLVDIIDKIEEEANKVEKRKESIANKKRNDDNKENKYLKVSKKQKNELAIKSEELEKIEKEIKEQTTIPKDKMKEIYKEVFKNIIFPIVILIYFILINIGYISIKKEIFVTELKVFSIILIITTICIFEYAYKKESGKYTIIGIELLMLAISTLASIRIYTIYNNKFISAITSISLLFAIYYVAKAIVIYVKKKREVVKTTNDIYKISKKR